METIPPTKEQVWNELRCQGCCWLGGNGCHCYSRQLKQCFAETEKRLTKTEYNEEEIAEKQKRNAKVMEDIDRMLGEIFG
jgi:hypothetical protein